MIDPNQNMFSLFSQSMADAAERAGASVVLVNARRRMPASGVAVAADLVLTADHVIEREEEITIYTSQGQELKAVIAGRDPASDLAVLRVNDGGLVPAVLSEEQPRVGELALTLARPGTNGMQAGLALVSAVGGRGRGRRAARLERYLRLDAAAYPGFSGGALVNGEGQVLGINTSGLSHSAFLSIPAALAWEIGQTLVEHGRIRRGYLGIRSQPVEVPTSVSEELGRKQPLGLLVVHVEPDSPAAAAGLMVGDILVGIDGQPVGDHEQLMATLATLVEQDVQAEMVRGGQLLSIHITIGAR